MAFLRKNVDVFAWGAYEAPGHVEDVKEEVNKLKRVGAINEVLYP